MSERAEDPDRRQDLRADCGRCAGLCCVAQAFAASADFAIDKPAGRPCPNLGADFGERGFPGCAVFDCFGAGQQVVQVTFGGRHWQENPASTTSMFTIFTVMRQLHELLWYLAEALALQPAGQLHNELKRAQRECERLTGAGPDELVLFDATAHRREVGPLLERVSQAVRAEVRDRGPDRSGADLIGTKLQGADLRGVSAFAVPTCSGPTFEARTCTRLICWGLIWGPPICAQPSSTGPPQSRMSPAGHADDVGNRLLAVTSRFGTGVAGWPAGCGLLDCHRQW